MVPILNGLSVNYPDFISASFSLGLDTISLREKQILSGCVDNILR